MRLDEAIPTLAQGRSREWKNNGGSVSWDRKQATGRQGHVHSFRKNFHVKKRAKKTPPPNPFVFVVFCFLWWVFWVVVFWEGWVFLGGHPQKKTKEKHTRKKKNLLRDLRKSLRSTIARPSEETSRTSSSKF